MAGVGVARAGPEEPGERRGRREEATRRREERALTLCSPGPTAWRPNNHLTPLKSLRVHRIPVRTPLLFKRVSLGGRTNPPSLLSKRTKRRQPTYLLGWQAGVTEGGPDLALGGHSVPSRPPSLPPWVPSNLTFLAAYRVIPNREGNQMYFSTLPGP